MQRIRESKRIRIIAMPDKTARARAQVKLQSKSYMPMEEAVADLIAGGRDRAIVIEVTAGAAEVVPKEDNNNIETSVIIKMIGIMIIMIKIILKIPETPLTNTRKHHKLHRQNLKILKIRQMSPVQTNKKNKKTNLRRIMPRLPNKKLKKELLMMKKFKLFMYHTNQIRSQKNLRRNTKTMVVICKGMTRIEIIRIEMIAEITGRRGIEATANLMRIIKIIAIVIIRTTTETIKTVAIRTIVTIEIIEIIEEIEIEIAVAGIKRSTMAQMLPPISDNTTKTTPNSTRLS